MSIWTGNSISQPSHSLSQTVLHPSGKYLLSNSPLLYSLPAIPLDVVPLPSNKNLNTSRQNSTGNLHNRTVPNFKLALTALTKLLTQSKINLFSGWGLLYVLWMWQKDKSLSCITSIYSPHCTGDLLESCSRDVFFWHPAWVLLAVAFPQNKVLSNSLHVLVVK